MFRKIIHKVSDLPLAVNLVGLGGSVVWFGWIKGKLDASYRASNHPVDYATGQTGFDGAAIKGYYQVMQDAGTLGGYLRTQIIDFGFIAAVFLLGMFLAALLLRFARGGSFGAMVAVCAGVFAMAGAGFDALENLISFVMLQNPTGFPDWLAYPYSGFAVVKFGCITAAMAAVLVALLAIGVDKVFRRAKAE